MSAVTQTTVSIVFSTQKLLWDLKKKKKVQLMSAWDGFWWKISSEISLMKVTLSLEMRNLKKLARTVKAWARERNDSVREHRISVLLEIKDEPGTPKELDAKTPFLENYPRGS